MKFASVRLVTGDIDRLLSFYAMLSEAAVSHPVPDFAEVQFGGLTLAISTEAMIKRFNAGAATAGANRSAIIELQVDDFAAVDALHARLDEKVECPMPPSDMPWGNRSMLIRDPDGNLINIFARPAGN
ncbi:MAG TPA: VOC family protein [Devosia sp.]|nr:VOC family protein [Devosia sp.]